jgi:hypothetical protein
MKIHKILSGIMASVVMVASLNLSAGEPVSFWKKTWNGAKALPGKVAAPFVYRPKSTIAAIALGSFALAYKKSSCVQKFVKPAVNFVTENCSKMVKAGLGLLVSLKDSACDNPKSAIAVITALTAGTAGTLYWAYSRRAKAQEKAKLVAAGKIVGVPTDKITQVGEYFTMNTRLRLKNGINIVHETVMRFVDIDGKKVLGGCKFATKDGDVCLSTETIQDIGRDNSPEVYDALKKAALTKFDFVQPTNS